MVATRSSNVKSRVNRERVSASTAGVDMVPAVRSSWRRLRITYLAPTSIARHPAHITLRCVRGLPRLRRSYTYEVIRRVLALYLELEDFRVVHVSIQRNHLHFIVEAASKDALSRRMQSFVIKLAKALNYSWGREGKVFAYRYSAKQIKSTSLRP